MVKLSKWFGRVVCGALLFSSSPISAAVIYDSIGSNVFIHTQGYFVGLVSLELPDTQTVAISFSSINGGIISEIDAYISSYFNTHGTTSTVTLGIMDDVAGLPSGTFIQSSQISPNLTNPVVLSSLNWMISPETTYWLTAVGASGTGATWNAQGPASNLPFGYLNTLNLDGRWVIEDGRRSSSPEARIITADIPEPSTWAMMIIGFLGVAFMARRRLNNQMLG